MTCIPNTGTVFCRLVLWVDSAELEEVLTRRTFIVTRRTRLDSLLPTHGWICKTVRYCPFLIAIVDLNPGGNLTNFTFGNKLEKNHKSEKNE